jgi:hypothetical protein
LPVPIRRAQSDFTMTSTDQLSPPRHSEGPSPRLAPGTVRRTSSLDVTWPQGQNGPKRLVGRARDFVVGHDGRGGHAAAEHEVEAFFGLDWKLLSIAASPPREALRDLVGASGGGGFRTALRQVISADQAAASPLALILDDVPGAVIVSGAAWSEWDPDWVSKMFGDASLADMLKAREGVCIGHAPGSSAQDPERRNTHFPHADAEQRLRSDDPDGWHVMPEQDGVGFRRARRIDIAQGTTIRIDAEFQDSATRPGGGRFAVHEYGLRVEADRETHAILSIAVDPRVLPYGECPAVAGNLPRLYGQRLDDLRQTVPASLPGAAGCTHLNDALRGLADVPALLHHLP